MKNEPRNAPAGRDEVIGHDGEISANEEDGP
jgi:hypothetical protein